MNALRVSWLFFKLGVLNELQYRVNFVVSALPGGDRARDRPRRARARLLAHRGVERLDAARASLRPRHPDPHGRAHQDVDPAQHDAADRGRPRREARLRADEARGRADARERSRGSHLAGRRRRLRARSCSAVGLSRISTDVSAADAVAFAVSLVLGAVLIYCFWLVIATVAFWVVNMWTAVELFDGVFQTGRWPIGIYPPWLRVGVTFLVPIAFAVTVPAEALTSRLDWQTLALAFVFAVRSSRSPAGSGGSACAATRAPRRRPWRAGEPIASGSSTAARSRSRWRSGGRSRPSTSCRRSGWTRSSSSSPGRSWRSPTSCSRCRQGSSRIRTAGGSP